MKIIRRPNLKGKQHTLTHTHSRRTRNDWIGWMNVGAYIWEWRTGDYLQRFSRHIFPATKILINRLDTQFLWLYCSEQSSTLLSLSLFCFPCFFHLPSIHILFSIFFPFCLPHLPICSLVCLLRPLPHIATLCTIDNLNSLCSDSTDRHSQSKFFFLFLSSCARDVWRLSHSFWNSKKRHSASCGIAFGICLTTTTTHQQEQHTTLLFYVFHLDASNIQTAPVFPFRFPSISHLYTTNTHLHINEWMLLLAADLTPLRSIPNRLMCPKFIIWEATECIDKSKQKYYGDDDVVDQHCVNRVGVER